MSQPTPPDLTPQNMPHPLPPTAPTPTKTPWYAQTWATIVGLVFLAPLGWLLMWKYRPWGMGVKTIVTAVSLLWFIAAMNNDSPEKAGSNDGSAATTVAARPREAAPAQPEAAVKPVSKKEALEPTGGEDASAKVSTKESLPENVKVIDIDGVGKRESGVVDQVQYVVIEVEKRKTIGSTNAGGMFYIVRVGAVNNDKETHNVTTSLMKLQDGEGREFDPSSDGSTALVFTGDQTAEVFSAQVQPGVLKQFTLVYDAPADARDLKLKIPSGAFSLNKDLVIKAPTAE